LLDGSVTTTASWPGELIAHASHTLPPPGAGKPAGLHAEIDVRPGPRPIPADERPTPQAYELVLEACFGELVS
jgi:hypothetical protein